MPAYTDQDDLEERSRVYGMWTGVVVARDDPEGRCRVRVRIPGIIDDESAWAWPMGGGSRERGKAEVPPLGADVCGWFKLGDLDHPYYMPGNWGKPGGETEVPAATDGGHPDVVVYAHETYDVVVDSRSGSKKFRIVDKAADDNVIEFDGATRTLLISSTAAIRIESSGTIDIEALVVTINGIAAGNGQL